MSSAPASSDNITFTLDPSGNLTSGTTYKTRVTTGVKDAAGNALSSQYDNSTGFTTLLPAPANFTATSGNGQNTLDWDNVTGATSYTVYWDNATGVSSSSTAITLGSADNYTHSSLTNGSAYYYKVAAVTASGTGTLSSEVNATPSNPNRIATGEDQSCAVLDNASLKCWGEGYDGQLGNGSRTRIGDSSGEMGSNLAAIDLGSGRTATAVSAGKNYTCALLDDASVKCWGVGAVGQLGKGSTTSLGDASGEMGNNLAAIDLGSGRSATAIEAGNNHTCAILDNASVKCWGRNNMGQLGLGDTNNRGDNTNEMGDNLTSIDLGSGRTATAIEAGGNHTCAILDDASLKCWGKNNLGQLGLGNTSSLGDASGEMGNNLAAVDLGSGRTATAISAGYNHTCALLDDASVKCWGDNAYGRLGQGSGDTLGDDSGEMGDNLVAIDLGSGRTATAISAGRYHTCALLDNSAAKCWGANDYGELGQGNTAYLGSSSSHMGDNLAAIDLGSGRTATAISAGNQHTCALLDNSDFKCWGYGNVGQLGKGSTLNLGYSSGQMGDNLTAIDL
jgi:alpha-tubulin suppressor-like RCC1 family protein